MWSSIWESLLETIKDSWILLPFLFATYIFIEFLEHEAGNKVTKLVANSKRLGPLIGSLLGVIPQCGFSAVASEFYAHRVITLGTLISIYLSTSDEMLPILIAQRADYRLILLVLGLKIVTGLVIGFLIDLALRNRVQSPHTCNIHKDDEDGSLLLSALKHTLEVFLFLFLVTLVLNFIIGLIGEDRLSGIILNQPFFGQFVAALIGLIPNCAGSVIVTQLYLSHAMNFGALMSGLLASAGVGPLMLFRINKNAKENWKVIVLLYIISVLLGLMIGAVFPHLAFC